MEFAVLNLLLVLSVIAQGEAVTQAIPWLIVPVIFISYLLFPRRGVKYSQARI